LCWFAATSVLACGHKPPVNQPKGLSLSPGLYQGAGQPLKPINDGDTLQIESAPQGGWVLFVGVQVTGFSPGLQHAQLIGRLVDPDTGASQADESHTIVLTPVPGDPSTLQPELRSISQVSNLVLCPNYKTRDVVGPEWSLELEMNELDVSAPQSGSVTRLVALGCPTQDPRAQQVCECQCAANFMPGKCP
jgi:hypothetical protein